MNIFQQKHVDSKKNQRGYLAVVLLVFVVASTIIATAAVSVSLANLTAASTFEEGTEAYAIAEAGIENALLRLLRDPSYTSETLTVGTGTATITVTGTDPQTIRSVGAIGTKKRTIQTVISRTSGLVTVTSWNEVYD